MKRKNQIILFLIILLTLIVVFKDHLPINGNKEQDRIRAMNHSSDSRHPGTTRVYLTTNETSFSINKGDRIRPSVTANYPDGSKKNVTEDSSYSTLNESVVTVDESGMISAEGPGFATITVTYEEVAKTIPVAVNWTPLQVNVKDYGASGNGKRDDTAAFQEAIDFVAKNGGGEVYVPKGTYSLHPIFLKSNVNLVGESRDSVILKLSKRAPDDFTRLVNLESVSNVKIQNITFDGNAKKHPKGIEHMHDIFAWDSKNILIDNNRMINAVGDGISISGSTETSDYVIISNNILVNNRRSNIVLEQVNNLQIFNNVSTSKIGRPALHFEPWEEMSFYHAKIWDNIFSSDTEGYCVQLEGGQGEDNFFHEVDFYNNNIYCPTGQFLVMETKNAKVHDNLFKVGSILIWIKNEDLTINNNEIDTERGITIEGTWGVLSKRTRIFDNDISTKENGLHITAGAQDTTILRNRFRGLGYSGVRFFASETDITNTKISNNQFENFEYGIFTDYNFYGNKRIDGLVVHDNTFLDFAEYALFIKGITSNVKMKNNIVRNASGVEIVANDRLMENIEIKNNRISGGKRGITKTESGTGAIKGLTISGNQISDLTE
ncbi:right-handed parallel beta-helix repeat-containing protein [Bacillus sp. B-jedd]|uniref:right-handed parallel beta-helix repeat-containing protein n=1 Tax=Bacillus sp. B-jedd TaxID=1476857 RepID=UPI00051564AB|nr:glycosyl hydrolase family 28-related protein [Bacillus sp. B-jedd]CEG28638.1 Pectin lyase-like protein [Bacillus sp. B-jedd]